MRVAMLLALLLTAPALAAVVWSTAPGGMNETPVFQHSDPEPSVPTSDGFGTPPTSDPAEPLPQTSSSGPPSTPSAPTAPGGLEPTTPADAPDPTAAAVLADLASAGTPRSTSMLRPVMDTCPGAPPSGGGMHRRPDSARDANGDLHKAWQEPFGDQFDVCHAAKPGEMGLGSDRNPAYRLSKSVAESLGPQIAFDAASGIAYVAWTEVYPEGLLDEGKVLGTILYTASDLTGSPPMWTRPQVLAGGGCSLRSLAVSNSRWDLEGNTGPHPLFGDAPCTPGSLQGRFDTDGDGISDADEVNAVLGFRTAWHDPDTDFDFIPDLLEIQNALNPLIDVQIEFPLCFGGSTGGPAICKFILNLLCLVVDVDGDGFSTCEEGQNYPVTTEVALFAHAGTATYRFWPKGNGLHNLVLRTQQRTYTRVPCPGLNVTIETTADGSPVGTFTRAWTDSGTPPWSEDTVASLDLLGINFNAVSASQSVDIQLTVTFDPAACGTSILSVERQLALDWLKVELASNRAEVNHKDADDTIAKSPSASVFSVVTEDMAILLDSQQKDLLLELDSMTNHAWVAGVLNEVINAYSDANIVLNYKVDETGLPDTGDDAQLSGDADSADEPSQYLFAHRNAAYLAYLHVMNVRYLEQTSCSTSFFHFGSAEQGGVGDDPAYGGVVLADKCLTDAYSGNELFLRRIGNMLHEIGHALNAAHDTSTGTANAVIDGASDALNCYNIMSRTASCPTASTRLQGVGKTDRRFGATEPIGRPRWSIESTGQFDLTSMVSVHVANNLTPLGMFT